MKFKLGTKVKSAERTPEGIKVGFYIIIHGSDFQMQVILNYRIVSASLNALLKGQNFVPSSRQIHSSINFKFIHLACDRLLNAHVLLLKPWP